MRERRNKRYLKFFNYSVQRFTNKKYFKLYLSEYQVTTASNNKNKGNQVYFDKIFEIKSVVQYIQ